MQLNFSARVQLQQTKVRLRIDSANRNVFGEQAFGGKFSYCRRLAALTINTSSHSLIPDKHHFDGYSTVLTLLFLY